MDSASVEGSYLLRHQYFLVVLPQVILLNVVPFESNDANLVGRLMITYNVIKLSVVLTIAIHFIVRQVNLSLDVGGGH